MNFNKLKYFYEIAKIKNLSKAAKQLYVSQSSLSKTISNLEEDFGNKLFYRTNRNLILTLAGKELFKNIEDFFSKEHYIYNKVRSIENNKPMEIISKIKVGYSPTEIGLGILSFKKKFEKKYPGTKILVKRLNHADNITVIKNKEIDLACATFGETEIPVNMDSELIIESYPVIILNKNHYLAKKKQISFDELRNEKFILMGRDKSSYEIQGFISWFRRNNFHPNIVEVFDHAEIILLQIQYSDSLTILSSTCPYRSYKDLIAIPINSPIKILNCLVWEKKNSNKYINIFVKEYKKWYLENCNQ